MSVISGIVGAITAEDAADEQVDAARYAADIQWKMYEQSREDMLPFLEAGYERIPYEMRGLKDYEQIRKAGPGVFEESPYYATLQGAIGEAANALGREASARGRGMASVGKELTRYAVPLAGQLRGQWINEWLGTKLNPAGAQGLVGGTPYSGTAGNLAQLGYGTGAGMAQSALYGGEAKASGYLGRGAAISGGVNTAINTLGSLYGMGVLGGGAAAATAAPVAAPSALPGNPFYGPGGTWV